MSSHYASTTPSSPTMGINSMLDEPGVNTAMDNSNDRIQGMEKVLHDQKGGSDEDSELSADKLMREEEESFYSTSHNEVGDDNIWGLLSGVGGNIYEWYDFAVYGLLAPEIGKAFFPSSSPELQLINSFGVYLAAFLMRPLGAILFGEIGDRLLGRKNALIGSIILITVPSVLMGLLPTYAMIGSAAPVLLVVLRMMQGLSVGGQLSGSYVLTIEQSSTKHRGFRGSICDASSVGGFFLASAVTTSIRHIFTQEQVENFAWRVPFWISLLLAPILYRIVSNTEDSKLWADRNEQKEMENLTRDNDSMSESPAVCDLLSSPFRRRQLAGMIGVLGSVTSSFYILFLFTPVYLSNLRGFISEKNADLMTFVIVGIYILLVIGFGKLSDQFPHRMDLMKIAITTLIVACPVMFGIFQCDSFIGYFIGQLQFAVILAMVEGGKAAWEVELWMNDPTLSFTGVAIGHNMASTLFGGTMPLMATFLHYRSEALADGDENAFYCYLIPALYVSFLACVALVSISYLIRHPHDIRTGEHKMREMYDKEQRQRKRVHKKKKNKKDLEYQLSMEYLPPAV